MTVTNTFEIELTMDPDAVAVPEIHAFQQESYTRLVEFVLKENGADWAIPENAACLIRYMKADGHGGVYSTLPDKRNAWQINGNRLTMTLVPQMLDVAGYVEATAVLMWGEEALTVSAFSLIVSRNPNVELIESADYFSFQNMDEINTALTALRTLQRISVESTDHPGCYYRVVDGVTEWLNPPGVLGVEYRTTERYNGYPVYTLLRGTGVLPDNASLWLGNDGYEIGTVIRGHGSAGDFHIPSKWEESTDGVTVQKELNALFASWGTVINSNYDASTHLGGRYQIWYTKEMILT